jgi:hypothetical protein
MLVAVRKKFRDSFNTIITRAGLPNFMEPNEIPVLHLSSPKHLQLDPKTFKDSRAPVITLFNKDTPEPLLIVRNKFFKCPEDTQNFLLLYMSRWGWLWHNHVCLPYLGSIDEFMQKSISLTNTYEPLMPSWARADLAEFISAPIYMVLDAWLKERLPDTHEVVFQQRRSIMKYSMQKLRRHKGVELSNIMSVVGYFWQNLHPSHQQYSQKVRRAKARRVMSKLASLSYRLTERQGVTKLLHTLFDLPEASSYLSMVDLFLQLNRSTLSAPSI